MTRLDWLVRWGPVCSRSVSLFLSTGQPRTFFIYTQWPVYIIHYPKCLSLFPTYRNRCCVSIFSCAFVFIPLFVFNYVFILFFFNVAVCLQRNVSDILFSYVSPSQIFWSLSIVIIVALRDVFPMRNIRQVTIHKRMVERCRFFPPWHFPQPLRNSADVWQWRMMVFWCNEWDLKLTRGQANWIL